MNNKSKSKTKKNNPQLAIEELFFQRICDEFLVVTQLNSHHHHVHLMHERGRSQQKK